MISQVPRYFLFSLLLIIASPGFSSDGYVPFTGARTVWHDGFDRYDFVMDEQTLAITPFERATNENFAVRDPTKGTRRCVIVVPKQAAAGQPWSWRGCYWDHQPQTEVELLRRGFHIAYTSANATLRPGKEWDAWYAFLTEKHGLSHKPAFIGMSRGGEYAYTWASANPDKVSCIYADNPGASRELLMKISALATNDVPLLHVCGSIDPLLGKNSIAIENIYQALGGRISLMIKDGAGHHPHSLRDPTPIADFIVQSITEKRAEAPDFLAGRVTRNFFYSRQNDYRDFPKEGTFITCRGPLFSDCYDRYTFELTNVEGAVTAIIPKNVAPGKPWVFRSEYVSAENRVDLALLAKGFHIITGPVSYNRDGPVVAHWNAVYKHLVDHGFSSKPVMEGTGRAAGDAYAWAIENGEKVSCIYAENPVLRSSMSKASPLENLAPLAKAGIPLLIVSGSADPAFGSQTEVIQARYKELGGAVKVIVREGEGHYPLGPADTKPVTDFIAAKAL